MNKQLTDALGVMKASGVMSLVMVEAEGLRKSVGAGSVVILHRSVCEPLAPDSLSELNIPMLKSVKGSAKPGAHKSEQMSQACNSHPDLHKHACRSENREPEAPLSSGIRREIIG